MLQQKIILFLLIMFGWIAGFEIFIPGIWEKTGYYITSSPAIFTLVLISPMVAFFGTAMAWKTVLSVYRCQKNPVLLLKYIIGEFAISNTIPSFGNAGRLARAALLSTQGVKVSISLSSVVIDAILSTFQTVLVMALILALGSYGIISVGGDLLLLLRVFLPSALIVLIIFLIFAKFKLKGIVKQGKITNLLLEINEGLSKIYAIPPKKMLQIVSWMALGYAGGIIEVLIIGKMVNLSFGWKELIIIQFISSSISGMLLTPFGIGTFEGLAVGTFAVLGYGIPEALIFTMFWRLKSIAYTVTGWILAGEGAIAAMKGFRLPINNKKMMPAEK